MTSTSWSSKTRRMCAVWQLASIAICVASESPSMPSSSHRPTWERYKHSHALVIKPALQEGTVVYEAA